MLGASESAAFVGGAANEQRRRAGCDREVPSVLPPSVAISRRQYTAVTMNAALASRRVRSFRAWSQIASPRAFEAEFDVIVVGAGHAGTEAAVAAARAGARVAIVTSALETIGQMSCNPAIGGVAKGTVVREVDALGGIMGRATDLASLQFRMLNRSKGPAVWAPRAQCDRGLYRRAVRTLLEEHASLQTIQGTVARLIIDEASGSVAGVETLEGRRFGARAVVITTGHVPARPDSHRDGDEDRRRPRRRVVRDASRRAAGATRSRGRAVQDGNAAANRWAIGRFQRARATGQRDRGVRLFVVALLADRRVASDERHATSGADSVLDHVPRRRREGESSRRTSRRRRCTAARSRRAVRATVRRSKTRSSSFPAAERHQLFLEPEGHDTHGAVRQRTVDVAPGAGAARDSAFGAGPRATRE